MFFLSFSPDRPITNRENCLAHYAEKVGVPRFPLYNLRQVFCTRISEVAPDAVVQRDAAHESGNKRRYHLGMANQVRQAVEKANESSYGKSAVLRFYNVLPQTEEGQKEAVANM